MEKLLPILNDLLIVTANLIIFTRMISWKNPNLRNKIIIYTGCTIIIAAYFLATYFYDVPASLSAALCMTFPSLVLFWIFSECKDSRFFLTFCFVDTVSLIIGFFGRYAGVLAGRVGIYVSFFLTLFLYAAIIWFGRNYFKKYSELLRVKKAGWTGMMLSSFLIYFVLIFTAAYPKPLIQRIEYGPSYALFGLVVLSCYSVFIHSIIKTKKISEQCVLLEKEKEFHKIAYTDTVTRLYNRVYYVEKINDLERNISSYQSLCCIVIDINDFKSVNDRFGHHIGDETLRQVSQTIQEAFNDTTPYVFRVGGDEFFVVLINVSESFAQKKLEELDFRMQQVRVPDGSFVNLASGYKYLFPTKDAAVNLESAFVLADKEMYKNKNAYKQNHSVSKE